MRGAGRPDGTRTGGWTQALARVLLFLALFLGLVVAGTLLLPPSPEPTSLDLVSQSAIALVAAITAGGVLLVRLDGRPFGALGFAWTSATLRELGLGLAIGVGAIAAAFALMLATRSVHFTAQPGSGGAWAAALGADFGLFAIAAAAEEALFRGYPLQILTRGIGVVPAVLATSVAFAVAHGANPNADPVALLNIGLAGVLLAAAYLRTRSLWFATSLHLGWNWGMASVLDLPVSGLEMLDTPLYEPIVSGPSWWSGGAFGPEGGVVGTVGFAVAMLALWKLPGVREADAMRALGPLVDEQEE